MDDLAQAIYRGITRRSPRTAGGPVRSVVAELVRTHGTRPPEGISAATWRRARSGRPWAPKPDTLAALYAAQRRARLPLGREAWLRRGHVGLDAVVRISTDVRDRRAIVSGWKTWEQRGFTSALITYYLAGALPAGAAEMRHILAQEVPDWEVLKVNEVRWFRTIAEAGAWQRAKKWRYVDPETL